ncbi:hypothetical protein BDV18DRAFT_144239 [Aspergillus unguis]
MRIPEGRGTFAGSNSMTGKDRSSSPLDDALNRSMHAACTPQDSPADQTLSAHGNDPRISCQTTE